MADRSIEDVAVSVQAEVHGLAAELEEMCGQITDLQSHIQCLEVEKEALLSEKEELLSEKETLLSEKFEAFQKYEDLQKVHETMKVEFDDLSKEYANLAGHQNTKQKIKHVSKIADENNTLRQDNYNLLLENQKLKDQIKKSRERLEDGK